MQAEENVANMLPIVPVTGNILTKSEDIDKSDKENFEKDSDIVERINKLNKAISNNDETKIEEAYTELRKIDNYEEVINESVLNDEDDIFYNRAKFENGDTNLLFIVGYSGGGKSTISGEQKKIMREVVDMDKIVLGMSKPDSYFKEIGNFAYKFITGPGEKYRCIGNTMHEAIKSNDLINYRPKISKDLFKFAEKYANSHRSTKLIMEGVWIYRYIDPSAAKQYAVYIKGTSLKTSTERAIKRDKATGNAGKNGISKTLYPLLKYAMAAGDAISNSLTKWQKYFKEKYEAQKEVEILSSSKSSLNKIKGISHDTKNGKIKEDLDIIKNSIKDSYKYSKYRAKEARRKIMKECVYEYVINDDITNMDSYVKESIQDDIINFKTKCDISRKLRLITLEIAVMKFKLKMVKPENKRKINDLKRAIIAKEKEKRSLSMELDPETREELKKLEKAAEKLAEKEFKEVEAEMADELGENDIKLESFSDVENFIDEVITEGAAKDAKKVFFMKTEKQFETVKETIKKLKDKESNLTYEEKMNLADEALEIINTLLAEVEVIPEDDFLDTVTSIKTYLNALKSILHFVFIGILSMALSQGDSVTFSFRRYIDPYKQKSEALKAIRKLQKEVNKQVIAAEKKAREEEKEAKEKEKEVKESVITENDDENLSPELKRLDEVLGDIAKYEEEKKVAEFNLKTTGESLYEKKIKGLNAKIKSLTKKKEQMEKEIEKHNKEIQNKVVEEAANMEDEIRPIVNKLNDLGYKVKYASPGHYKLRKKEDKEPDGVYYDRLYSDARIMFDDKYDFGTTPKYWYFKDVDGCSYLDIAPIRYHESDGTPDEAFKKWKDNYMTSLKNFVSYLEDKKNNSEDNMKEMTIDTILQESYDKFEVNIPDLSPVNEGFSLFNKKSEKDKLKDDIEKLKKLKASGKISQVDYTKKVSELQNRYMSLVNSL